MNIIFLDIDGVLNSECFYIKRYRNMRELRMIDVNSLGEKDPRVKRILCEIDLYNLDILKHQKKKYFFLFYYIYLVLSNY